MEAHASPKLACLWSSMSEVKFAMRKQHTYHIPVERAKMPNGQKLFTQHQHLCIVSTTRKKTRYKFSTKCVNFSVNRTFCPQTFARSYVDFVQNIKRPCSLLILQFGAELFAGCF